MIKMPYSWKGTPEKIRQYPIIISRLGDGFNRSFKVPQRKKPITPAIMPRRYACLVNWLRVKWHKVSRIFSLRSTVTIISYEAPPKVIHLSAAPIFPAYQAQNTDPRVTLLDTVSLTYEQYPMACAAMVCTPVRLPITLKASKSSKNCVTATALNSPPRSRPTSMVSSPVADLRCLSRSEADA